MVRFRSLVCLLAVVIAGFSVEAQQITGSIRGTVVDPSGAVVSGATVSARQTETGLARNRGHGPRRRLRCAGAAGRPLRGPSRGRGASRIYSAGNHPRCKRDRERSHSSCGCGLRPEQVQVHADAQLIESGVTSLGKAGFRTRSA